MSDDLAFAGAAKQARREQAGKKADEHRQQRELPVRLAHRLGKHA